MADCLNCGKKINKRQTEMMIKALSLTEGFRGMGDMSNMLKTIDDKAGIDLATLKELKDVRCLDCMIKKKKEF